MQALYHSKYSKEAGKRLLKDTHFDLTLIDVDSMDLDLMLRGVVRLGWDLFLSSLPSDA